MMISREALRREAKKIYKEKTKGIPRRNRIPFSQFFKQFKKMKAAEKAADVEVPQEDDFNFEDLVNINQISDDDLVTDESDSNKE